MMKILPKQLGLIGLAILSVFMPPVWAFSLGLVVVLVLGNDYQAYTTKLSKTLLQVCVVGLGFGIQVDSLFRVGALGLALTIATIAITLCLAIWLGRRLGVSENATLLIGAGTAICGGSAIAAVTSAINAKSEDTALALATVFGLNALALFIFPVLGHGLGLSDAQFGLWAAIAIHDTSSVVGAAQQFGNEALNIATAVKLQRALWIVPLVLFMAYRYNPTGEKSIKVPWFIGLFILAVLFSLLLPSLQPYTQWLAWGAKKGLSLTLFLIGVSFQFALLKRVGIRPLLLGVSLWVVISVLSLLAVQHLALSG